MSALTAAPLPAPPDFSQMICMLLPKIQRASAGAMMAKSLTDSLLFKSVGDDYYGHRGEFDLNDESRRVSEDMQQFYGGHRGADKTDHYDWADVLDADTDGYFGE